MADIEVRRVDFGYFVRPASETGTGSPRVEPCLGYIVDHPAGLLLFDTGMGGNAEIDDHYRPRRRPLHESLALAGATADDIRMVANCHLHFDHCGGNPEFAGIPIFTQALELDTARNTADYTLPDLVDPPALRYEEISGEVEVLTGVLLVPTPGHTDGHQSLVVRRRDGTVILAGQARDSASEFSADVLARRARLESHGEPLPLPPAWIERLERLDPARVLFAHDHAEWIP